MDCRFWIVHGKGSPTLTDAYVSMFWILAVGARVVIEMELGVGAVEHVSIGGRHTFAGFRWEVELEGWCIPCGGVDYLADKFHGVFECGCDVGFEFIIRGEVETLEQEAIAGSL